MKSLTKIKLDNETIARLFLAAGIDGIEKIQPLIAGEFNSVFCVSTSSQKYVIKIAPHEHTEVLTYEKNLLRQELDTYAVMCGKTQIKTPHIYYSDFSKTLIPAEFFIMEYLPTPTLAQIKLKKEKKLAINVRLAEFLGELHRIKGAGFGYVQNGLHPDWYTAIKDMISNLIADAARKNKKLHGGHKLLAYVEKHKEILQKVDAVLVNFDLWDVNVFYAEKQNGCDLSLIDPERSFYGDRLGDFIAVDVMRALEKKRYLLEGYHISADVQLEISAEEKIRYYILKAYLALIVLTERHYRYQKTQGKYWLNTLIGKMFLSDSLKRLRKLSVE
ncbi:MAG: aminoglycoside phosphotransferase family protein [Firmicutes bacterium]|nr:aminoglycoside phosphotransferase family protein [Bacillota bacterium]